MTGYLFECVQCGKKRLHINCNNDYTPFL
ncbi:hypothetical protein J3U22_10915 [Gilliamella sp. B2865]|nr:hypothetical protein [Gilliamella sp. B3482]MCX8583652.1 hypothetical protein [Gilliamella sp. B3372]MCX8586645.1 hypothetical protein [Gilliamella sp. B3562]MCX8594784.1 hypothetical protein [Gilliamella sp. B3367]MCX8671790.1 hypothetical protein [Gilliamella sp. B2785]MCX8675496.1 hypothetical protein [Gilliamella sp. B3023]MCX8680118.1 hypothetical protein [Gilliamella sp. B2865]MCX8686336.1 hypothetical protein [Gilliamella sp. B2864]